MAKITKIRVSLYFAQKSDGNLAIFAAKVVEALTKEALVFTALPVSTVDLAAQLKTYTDALRDGVKGGEMATVVKNEARAVLLDSLNKDALYVQIVANNDLSTLLSSGFEAASTNRAQAVLAQVQIDAVETPQTGQLKARVKRVVNAKSFEGRIKTANGSEFGPSISFASSRKIFFDGLTAGANYILQVRAIGGSTGRGDWSEPTTKMAI
jgi:hypothetical protein